MITVARARLGLVSVVLLALASGCAGAAATSGVGRVDEAQRMRAGLGGRDAQTLAPQAFAAADQELRLAKEAQAAGDTTGADLHAERALATYNQAIALARLARATQDEAAAGEALTRASSEAQKYAAQRKIARPTTSRRSCASSARRSCLRRAGPPIRSASARVSSRRRLSSPRRVSCAARRDSSRRRRPGSPTPRAR